MPYTIKQFGKPEIREHLSALQVVAKHCSYEINLLKIPILFVAYSGEEIVAFAGLASYHGYWCLRICVVPREHRGNGLQRKLIRARINYLRDKTKWVNAWVKPTNAYSLNNLVEEGFRFMNEKTRIFKGVEHIKMRKILI